MDGHRASAWNKIAEDHRDWDSGVTNMGQHCIHYLFHGAVLRELYDMYIFKVIMISGHPKKSENPVAKQL